MRFRSVAFPLFILTIGFLLISASSVSAQTDDTVHIISLSGSGYERANSVSFSPDGTLLAVGGSSGIYLFDTWNLSALDFIQTNTWARSVAFLSGSNRLAAGLFDGTIKLWRIPEMQPIQNLTGHQGWVRSISVSRDGTLIASASDDDTIRIWKTADGETILILNKDTQGVRAVALSPDGQLVAAALEDMTVHVWRVANGELLYTLIGHESWVRCLAFSPDGALLASGSFDKTVRLWNVSDGRLLHTLEGHTASVLGVAFSPDGSTVASGSVDETVRLWQVADGSPIRVLYGHTDFVYTVAFSPDGKTLASGGADNAVRVWDLEKLSAEEAITKTSDNSTVQNEAEHQAVSSDCRQCHHSHGKIEPPRVIELSCEGCHNAGIGQSWCIAFPRSTSVASTPIAYSHINELSGVPGGDNEIAIVIASPGNGETLYVKGNYTAPEFITGKVFYTGQSLITDVEVRLDILSGAQIIASLVTHPSRNGDYNFNVAINPESPPPYLSRPGTRTCLICHGDFLPDAGLPKGEVRLVVTATIADGSTASDERWLRIDTSGEAVLPVQVVDEITKKPLPGLKIQASTILYEWRDRFDGVVADANGNAQLHLEALSQATTTYDISIRPEVYNGTLYTSREPVQVTLEPGATSHPTVTLMARAQMGQITGSITAADSPLPLAGTNVWAVQLPAGPVYQTRLTSQNTFSFLDIPVNKYLIIPDSTALAQKDISVAAQQVDLASSLQSDISFALTSASQLSGRALTQNGVPLPFAWVTWNKDGMAQPISPFTGKYRISDLPLDPFVLTASAPGYYSKSQAIASSQTTVDFDLALRPETRLVTWGDGQVVLPSETNAIAEGLTIKFEQGWLWGTGAAIQPLIVQLPEGKITISSGRLALEAPKVGAAWLYIYQGQAQILSYDDQDLVKIGSGQMIALQKGSMPIDMEESVIQALHPMLGKAPLFEVIQPTLKARIQNWLAKAGIETAQMVTFITYFLSLVTLLAIPLVVLSSYKKKGKKGN
ncbi:MAG: WD40 domain-containing protein [Anaerolineales bacterium]